MGDCIALKPHWLEARSEHLTHSASACQAAHLEIMMLSTLSLARKLVDISITGFSSDIGSGEFHYGAHLKLRLLSC